MNDQPIHITMIHSTRTTIPVTVRNMVAAGQEGPVRVRTVHIADFSPDIRQPDFWWFWVPRRIRPGRIARIRQLYLRFPSRFVVSIDAKFLSCDKWLMAGRFKEAGIPHPVTLRRPDWELASLWVAKPRFGQCGWNVTLVHNQTEFEALDPSIDWICQPFMGTADRSDYRALVTRQGVVEGLRKEAAPGDFRGNRSCGATLSLNEPSPEEVDVSRRASEALGLWASGVDYLRTPQGPVILEANANFGMADINTHFGSITSRRLIDQVHQELSSRPTPTREQAWKAWIFYQRDGRLLERVREGFKMLRHWHHIHWLCGFIYWLAIIIPVYLFTGRLRLRWDNPFWHEAVVLLALILGAAAVAPLRSLIMRTGWRAVLLLLLPALVCWGQLVRNDTRTYPFISWNMYTNADTLPEFLEYVAVYADGTRGDFPFHLMISMSGGRPLESRFGKQIRSAPGPEQAETVKQELRILAELYNRRFPENPVEKIIVNRLVIDVRAFDPVRGPGSIMLLEVDI